jgi:hypothetical protein
LALVLMIVIFSIATACLLGLLRPVVARTILETRIPPGGAGAPEEDVETAVRQHLYGAATDAE